jgi:hypothetical protein
MLFSEKDKSSMQQEDKLDGIRYVTNVPLNANPTATPYVIFFFLFQFLL